MQSKKSGFISFVLPIAPAINSRLILVNWAVRTCELGTDHSRIVLSLPTIQLHYPERKEMVYYQDGYP
jgi:hypothetical protein